MHRFSAVLWDYSMAKGERETETEDIEDKNKRSGIKEQLKQMNDWALGRCCFSLLSTKNRWDITVSDCKDKDNNNNAGTVRADALITSRFKIDCWDVSLAVLITLSLNSKSSSKTGGTVHIKSWDEDNVADNMIIPQHLSSQVKPIYFLPDTPQNTQLNWFKVDWNEKLLLKVMFQY